MSRLLIYHIGTLGDSLVAAPCFWLVRELFPAADRVLLTRDFGERAVLPHHLFAGTGLFHDAIVYAPGECTRLQRLAKYLRLWHEVRRGGFDGLVYLAPSLRTRAQLARDAAFFRSAGIRRLFGLHAVPKPDGYTRPLPHVEREAEQLLARLSQSGLSVPPLDSLRKDLGINQDDRQAVARWRARLPPDGRRPWLAIAPGSLMPAKVWPRQRFEAVVAQLIPRFDVWPVVFGGAADREIGSALINAWGRGYNAAGALAPRESAAALELCLAYIGNDTGTMHLAASAGVPCVGIFSAREWPGSWDPIGTGHAVLRKAVDCEGCRLVACERMRNHCLNLIEVTEVLAAANAILERKTSAWQDNRPSSLTESGAA